MIALPSSETTHQADVFLVSSVLALYNISIGRMEKVSCILYVECTDFKVKRSVSAVRKARCCHSEISDTMCEL